MNTQMTDSEIEDLFAQLKLSTEEDRQKALFVLSYADALPAPQSVRYDIGFNASLPSS